MRFFTFLMFLFFVNETRATNYYFSSSLGDDARSSVQAQSSSTPWRSLDKFNVIATTLRPGDSVLFRRGDAFYGTLVARASGVAGNVIYYGAFGSGAAPLFTGFTTLTNWTLHSGSIYSAPLDMPNLSMVTINGTARSMGRFPNTGYLKYENNNANSSITDNELAASPNWSGGEIVMRKFRFILDRHKISTHNGTTLTYTTSTINGNNAEFLPVKNNGYFIQGHLSTLDQQGEWYYDETAKRLFVHFGGSSPSGFTVKASTLEMNAAVEGVNHVQVEGLSFEGANLKGLSVAFANNILIKDCHFYNQGATSLHGDYVEQVTVKGGSVNTSFSNGINFEHGARYCTVDGVSVNNSNTIAGTGRSGSGVSIGISVTGEHITISNNRVVGAGYSGIQFLGNNVLVERNYIDTFCTLKDDGGGVYTFIGASNETSSNRKIRNNIILNAIGAQAGTEAYGYEPFGKAAGIYLDEHVNNCEITGNSIANGDWGGIFLHNAHTNVINNNIIYNFRYQVHVSQYTATTRNNTMTGNQYIAKQPFQSAYYYRTFVPDNPSTMGLFNNNFYARPIKDDNVIQIDNFFTGGNGTTYITLAQWKSLYNLDAASQKSPLTYSSNIDDNLRFEHNATNDVKTVALSGNYIDVKNNQYAGSIGLQPFTSVVLLKSTATFLQNQVITFPAVAEKVFGEAPFTVNATATSGLPVSYRVVSGPATVSGNTVTLTGVGHVTLEATQAGNGSFKPAEPVMQNVTVLAPTTQAITFPALANKKFGDAPFTLSATATSGLPVSYRVVSGLATVSGNTVTITGAAIQTIIIEAMQEGNATFRAAPPVRRSFTVARASQFITFGALQGKAFGNPPFPVAATASSGLPVVFRVTSGPATVAGSMISLTGVGEVFIEAAQPGDSNYEPASFISRNFYVSQGVQTISFPAIPNRRLSDGAFQLNATATSGLAVSYRVSSGPATVSGNTVTPTGNGEVWIEATQPGNANYSPAAATSRSFVITSTKSNQTITFPTIANKTFGDAPFVLNGTASSGLPVNYRVVSGQATVSGNTLTLTGAGPVTIEASQPGNTTYNAAPMVTRSFSVFKANQAITFPTIPTKSAGDAPFTVNATASSGLPVSFRIVSGPATVSGNTITLTGTGEVMVEASQPGSANFNAASLVSQPFLVTGSGKQSQAITFTAIGNKTFGNPPFSLSATASSGLPVTYAIVSGPATLAGNTVTLTGAGNVVVEARQGGNETFSAAPPVQQTITVAKAAQSLSFGTLSNKTNGDAPFTISAASSSGLPASFRIVSGPATINGNTITLTGTGTVVVEATQGGNNNYHPATPVQQSFAVLDNTTAKQNQSITFGTLGYKTYNSPPFDLTATASSGLPVSYRVVSGPVTISGSVVTITGVGSVVIEAAQDGDAAYNAAAPVQRGFTIGKASQFITFPAIANKTTSDAPFPLEATATSGLTVVYRVSAGPATVSGNMVTVTGTGTVWIEASQPGDVFFNSAPLTSRGFSVTVGSSKLSQTITFPALANRTFGDAPFDLSATASSGLPVSYRVVSGPATLNGNTVTITSVGHVTIEAAQPGNNGYNAAPPVTQSFSVAKATQSINFGSLLNRTIGDTPFALNATTTSGLPVGFRIVSGPATLSGNTVTLTGTGLVTVEATQPGDGNYLAATPVAQSFTVQGSGVQQNQAITFNSLGYKTYNSPPFDLTATASSGLPVSYRVVSGPVTISGSVVTITGVGSVVIEALQDGDAAYSAAAPVQRSFTVGKAGQSLTFPTPADKTFGEAPFALSATASSGLPVAYRVVSGPATVSGNMVTLTGTGTVTIEAVQAGNSFYQASYSLQRSFSVVAAANNLLTQITPVVPEQKKATASINKRSVVTVFPNPLKGQGLVRIDAAQTGKGYVTLYDRGGRLVKSVGHRLFEKGHTQVLDLSAMELSSGTYYIRVAIGKEVVSKAFQVL